MPFAEKNKKSMNAMDTYAEVARLVCRRIRSIGFDTECVLIDTSANAGFDLFDDERNNARTNNDVTDASDFIVDIREYDVPYHVRVAIDKGSPILPLSRRLVLTVTRYSDWKMVYSRSQAWRYHFYLHRGAFNASRAGRPSLRYRNHQVTPEVPGRCH